MGGGGAVVTPSGNNGDACMGGGERLDSLMCVDRAVDPYDDGDTKTAVGACASPGTERTLGPDEGTDAMSEVVLVWYYGRRRAFR